MIRVALAPESSDKVKDDRKHNTKKKTSCEWKVEGSVLAPIDNVTGQAAQRKASLTQKNQNEPQHHNAHPNPNQDSAEFVHNISLTNLHTLRLDCHRQIQDARQTPPPMWL